MQYLSFRSSHLFKMLNNINSNKYFISIVAIDAAYFVQNVFQYVRNTFVKQSQEKGIHIKLYYIYCQKEEKYWQYVASIT